MASVGHRVMYMGGVILLAWNSSLSIIHGLCS
jgi:hypothetical protein